MEISQREVLTSSTFLNKPQLLISEKNISQRFLFTFNELFSVLITYAIPVLAWINIPYLSSIEG